MRIYGRARRLLTAMLPLLVLPVPVMTPCGVLAQGVPPRTTGPWTSLTPNSDKRQVPSVRGASSFQSPLNLDLSSLVGSLYARNQIPVTILTGGIALNGTICGGAAQTINPGKLLTPSQFLAVNEVLRGGQTLLINTQGQAVGGSATLSASRIHQLASLVVPKNVTVDLLGFTAANPLSVSGDINISGSLYALQKVPDAVSVLRAGSLSVSSLGLVSGNLPSGLKPGNGIFASAGLTLNVLNNLSNSSTITTPGNLSINTGGSIFNQSTAGTTALMSAQNINLNAATGQIINSGLVQALNNISLNTKSSGTDLNVFASGGVFQCFHGTINLRDSSFAGTGNTSLSGGNWLSQKLNLNSGLGAIYAQVGEVSGIVNARSGSAHVIADTPRLTLGNDNISGDPTYVNAGGDIQIVGTVTETEDLAIIAAGNITTNGPAQIVDNGHNVWLIAGANVNIVNGACSGCGNSSSALTLPSGTDTPITSGYVQVGASGGTGGNIDLQTGNTLVSSGTVIDTSGPTAGSSGGNVTLVAISNGFSGGKVLFPTTPGVMAINSSGNTSGANGNVTVIAGAGSGQGVSIGAITTSGGSGTAGNVSISAAQSAFSGGADSCSACMSFASGGVATGAVAATTPAGSNPGSNGSIVLASDISSGGMVILSTGGTGTITQTAGTVSAGSLIINAGGDVGNLQVAAPSITTTQSGAGSITLTDAVSLTGNGASTAGSGGFSFTDTASGGITTTNAITSSGPLLLQNTASSPGPITIGASGISGTVVTVTGNSGNITLNGPVTGATVAIDAGGAGNITGQGLVTGTTSVTLGNTNYAEAGDIGPLTVSTPYITDVTDGKVILTDTQVLTGNGMSGGGSFSLTDLATAAAAITITNYIGAYGTLSLTASSPTNAGIVINADVNGGDHIIIAAAGSGRISGTGMVIAGNSISLVSGSGDIGPLTLHCFYVTANTRGNVTLTDVMQWLGNGVSTGANFSLTDTVTPPPGFGSSIQITNAISASGTLRLTAPSSTIYVGAPVSGTIDNILTPSLTIVGNGSLEAVNGNLNIDSNGPGQALTIDLFRAGDSLISSNGNVLFNGNSAGPITITAGGGNISAGGSSPVVTFNGGANAVNVNVSNIAGCVGGSGNPFAVQTASGLSAGGISSAGTVSLSSAYVTFCAGCNIYSSGLLINGSPWNEWPWQPLVTVNPSTSTLFSGKESEKVITVILSVPGDAFANGLLPTDMLPLVAINRGLFQGSVSLINVATAPGSTTDTDCITGAFTYFSKFDENEINRLAVLGVASGARTKDDSFDLVSGNCVFAPRQDLLVYAGNSKVFIPGGSIVFIMNMGTETAIYDLHDNRGSAIKVLLGNDCVTIDRPGDMFVITDVRIRSFKDVEGVLRWIAYRNVRGPGKRQGACVYASEFSLSSALKLVAPLREMRNSKDTTDRTRVEKILKDAAILMRLGSLSPYTSDQRSGNL